MTGADKLKLAYYRSFQGVFNVGERFMAWRKPELTTGPGSIAAIPSLLAAEGVHRPLLVTGPNIVKTIGRRIMSILDAAGYDYAVFSEVEANPSVATNEYFKGGETWPVCLAAAEGLINYVPEIVWPPFSSVYSAEDATEMASIKTEQENYMKEWRAYFITGQRDIDADWDEYVAGYDGMNTARYMELYRAAREAMGVE